MVGCGEVVDEEKLVLEYCRDLQLQIIELNVGVGEVVEGKVHHFDLGEGVARIIRFHIHCYV